MTVLRLPNLARDSSCLRRRRQHTDGVAALAGFAGAWRHSALRADITDTLRALKAKHVLVVADSCYSGTLTRSIGVQALDNARKPSSTRGPTTGKCRRHDALPKMRRQVLLGADQTPENSDIRQAGGDFLFVHR